MTRVLIFICIFSSHLVFARSQAEIPTEVFDNVFENDTRVAVSAQAPWQSMGKLVGPDNSYCTATLVSRDVILTAAHCVMDGSGHYANGPYRFEPAVGINAAQDSSVVDDFWWGTTDPDDDRGSDWLIGRLRDPLGDKYGWMKILSFSGDDLLQNRDYYLGAYSGDFQAGDVASWEHGCLFTEFDPMTRTDFHNCDMSEGASGAAIFYYDGTAPTIAAINVAEFRDGGASSLIDIPYSDEHANLAVPTAAFYVILQAVITGNNAPAPDH